MPYCRECGTEVSLYDAFCPSCRNDLDFTKPREEDEQEPEKVKNIIQESAEASFEESVGETEEESYSTKEEGVEETDKDEEPAPIGFIAKTIAILCIPIASAGVILEILSIYTLIIGEYTIAEFLMAVLIFGAVTIIPSAYLYYIYRRRKAIQMEEDK